MKFSAEEKLQPKRGGQVTINPEEQDDLWVLSNLIKAGDTVTADTTRKAQFSCSGKSNQLRVGCLIVVKITGVEYVKDSHALRVRGKIASHNPYVGIGCFHTLELETGKKFMLQKKSWDEGSIKSLNECCSSKKKVVDLATAAVAEKAILELKETFVFRPDRACYGSKSVVLASEMAAIKTLFIMDDVLRNKSNVLRKKYTELVSSVEEAGGKTVVLSAGFVSGAELVQLSETGVAAILRFPVFESDD